MSLRVAPLPALPEDAARVARAAFKRKANIYLTVGDQLGTLFDEVDFGCLYAVDGKPALSPNLLALMTIFQFMENLPDREAADAVRSRLDWKYALHLSLEDAGFDDSVLSEFRQRLVKHELAQELFERVLKKLQDMGLVQFNKGFMGRGLRGDSRNGGWSMGPRSIAESSASRPTILIELSARTSSITSTSSARPRAQSACALGGAMMYA